MRTIFVGQPGPNGRFELVDRPDPEPGPGEVTLQVEAVGLAFADVLMRAKAYPGTPKNGFVPGYDVIGRVAGDATVAGDIAPGDRVAALIVRGGLAERATVNARRLVPVPAELDAAAAACLPLNYLTAYQMLHRIAKVAKGATVLVFGAGGGVGTALCELAALHDCRVIGVASQGKHERIASMGAIPVAARTPNVAKEIRAAVGERGADACFDPVGGSHLTLGWNALAPTGHLVSFGFAGALFGAGSMASVFLRSQLRMAWWRLTGGERRISFYSITTRMESAFAEYSEDLTTLFELLRDGKISPVIDSTITLDSVPAAYERLREGTSIGKIVVRVTSRS